MKSFARPLLWAALCSLAFLAEANGQDVLFPTATPQSAIPSSPGLLSRALLEARLKPQSPAPQPAQEEPSYVYPDTRVYGGNLFQGNFAAESISAFNPNHVISIGNVISVKIWGLFEFQDNVTVDEQGNLFVPRIGPIQVLGVQNKDLTKIVESKIRTRYSGNLGVYCNLAVAQPVKIFVTGAVRAPGTYSGKSSDSVIRFLDRAKGIDPDRGSFLQVDVLRRGKLVNRYNLYDFIRQGSLPDLQFLDGDTILVQPRQNTIAVTGVVLNDKNFEFAGANVSGKQIFDYAVPLSEASHVRLFRKFAARESAEYLTLEQASKSNFQPGDEVEVVSDRKTQSIGIRIEGEHAGEHMVIVPYGAKLKDVLPKIAFMPTSNRDALQLFRKSVKEAQRETLLASLDRLEKIILTSQSSSADEARIRTSEAEIFLKWIEKARKIEPKGQVVLDKSSEDFLLEPGDVLRIPRVSDVVMVQGEVNFPSSFAYSQDKNIKDYIEMAGGYNDFGTSDRVLVLRPNGAFEYATLSWFSRTRVHPGDQVLALPEVKTKFLQIAKDVTQIIYQIAVSTGVVLRLI